MKINFKSILINFFVLILFVVASLAYFTPVLQGKKIFQSDIAQYTGMAKEQNNFREKTNTEPYWTNSAFGGMPTYQLGANYPHNYIKKLDKLIRFLPRPADYLFLYFLGFYILLCCLKVDYRLAAIGALAFGFSTYLIIILGVGHNAKAHALGYIPMLLGGIVLMFRKKYILGFILTAFAMALEVNANHYQMTYYFMLLILILGIIYLIYAIKEKQLKHYFTSVGLLLVAVLIGVATNATNLMATKEYSDWSTRGKSNLTINNDGSPRESTGGLDKEYITQYSYGIAESLNIFVPRLFGGSNSENLGTDSKAYEFLIRKGLPRKQALDFAEGLPLYWGDQPGVSGAAYVGAVLFFLFVLGLFIVKGKVKWWLLAGVIMSLLLSWGKNFSGLTNFMIDNFPLYDKFRAVSSIQVVLELCIPLLGILALMTLFKEKENRAKYNKSLLISAGLVLGTLILLFLVKGTFTFDALSDDTYRKYFGDEVLTMIKLDRQEVYTSDVLRSLIYVLLAAVTISLFIHKRLKLNIFVIVIGILILADLVPVAKRYVTEDDFVSARQMEQPFPLTTTNKQINQDTSVYRVYNPKEGLNGASTSYYHNSIGGYHGAKPATMQDLFDFHIYKNNVRVLSMLNVKYVIQEDEEGRSYPAVNPNAMGNAWFVQNLRKVTSSNDEIMALDSLNIKTDAVVNTSEFPLLTKFSFAKDSTATINLDKYEPNHLTYTATTQNEALAVFSEMYYKNGWNAYIDGKSSPYFKVNYTLRALQIPAGKHKIEFKFEPEVVKNGSKIALASNILLALIVIGGIIFSFKKTTKKEDA
ncbi:MULTISPECIES: YfhO family protein [unclassified Cellulophaga]|uniref:YfhO family protein n=1 Tax=unclassified Cellulophaga TaxID=2634405 RepID=UPI0026E1D84F|nr:MULTISPECIES: YfhO family protein [unclassified Cellulophaga]MDO6491572.1 YfhO family protein [Cellulophaga sp. 2_MG-2023]MDO6493449.1 YfhO family protein [Cellulophaga sp. 3_MG-2023]